MRVLVAGGGTGGHFYPGLAILEGLRARDPELSAAYVGTRAGIEARILPSRPWIRFYPVHARGFARAGGLRNLGFALRVVAAMFESLWILARFRPQVIVGVGGYSSFAPVLLGALLGRVLPIRTLIHEQNVIGGLANRSLSRFVDRVLISFEASRRSFPHARRIVVTGNPIREEFLHVRRSGELYRRFGLDPDRRTILVFGGSRGSTELTDRILSSKDIVGGMDGLQLLLITGDEDATRAIRSELERARVGNVAVETYVERMGEAFALADLVVCRAGATSLAEITACGKASILIPWRAAADDHQWRNARMLEEQEACAMVDERSIVARDLVREIVDLVRDERALAHLAENAGRLGRRGAGSRILGEIQAMMRGAST